MSISNDQVVAQDTKSLQGLLQERASKRALSWGQNHRLAEEHCKNGDSLLEKGDYTGACASYVDATILWSSNPVSYTKLAEAYIKCHLYAEAAHAATRALSLNPKSLEARYQRGISRAAQGLLKPAEIDFELILSQDSTHALAQSALSKTLHDLPTSLPLASALSTTITPFNTPVTVPTPPTTQPETETETETETQRQPQTPSSLQVIDFAFPTPTLAPSPSTPAFYTPSLSDSSDCFHVGNGIPCRFYNTHSSGCALGASCRYSHSPDEKSVRDDLGKNVCIYYLLSICKFGLGKCVYSHCKEYLPAHPGAWWSTPEGIEKVRKVVELAERRGRGKAGKRGENKEPTDEGVREGEANTPNKEMTRGTKSPASGKRVKSATPVTLETITNRKQLLNKPNTLMKTNIAPVYIPRYIRWTEHGVEDLERKVTGEVLVRGFKKWDDNAHKALALDMLELR